MDLGTLLGLIVSIGVPAIGGLVAAAKLFQKVADHDEELVEVKARLDKSEEAVMQVGQLAASIDHLAARFADQIKHLVDAMGVQNEHVRSQLSDIKEDLRGLQGGSRRRVSGD